MKQNISLGLAALALASGFTAVTGGTASAQSAARPCPPPAPTTTTRAAYDKKTVYQVPGRKIYLRTGKVRFFASDCGEWYHSRYGWATAKGHKGKYVRLEVDTNGNKIADAAYTRYLASNRDDGYWTTKRRLYGAKYMRACVVSRSSSGCSSGHTTSWWPVR
ncbi:hypothetical protein [Thermomonospora umbrina]|uniref:Secreted protein n=1 Tax=Thermomonospora umbrina TaxID=111806 RepID=A0A3D9ST85_9ACTN|nr:hypothetical protein [Thermomonospora umbrina]REE99008.1 hypothetical protein DFJ69_4510 [Thermomonospora umbrina]